MPLLRNNVPAYPPVDVPAEEKVTKQMLGRERALDSPVDWVFLRFVCLLLLHANKSTQFHHCIIRSYMAKPRNPERLPNHHHIYLLHV